MGRSKSGGETEQEGIKGHRSGRREGRQPNDWQKINEKRINQAKTGMFFVVVVVDVVVVFFFINSTKMHH